VVTRGVASLRRLLVDGDSASYVHPSDYLSDNVSDLVFDVVVIDLVFHVALDSVDAILKVVCGDLVDLVLQVFDLALKLLDLGVVAVDPFGDLGGEETDDGF